MKNNFSMVFKNVSKNVVLGLAGLLLISCGSSGGSSDNPTDPNQSFSTSKYTSTSLGTLYTTSITASDTDNNNFTGSLSISNRATETQRGISVTPRHTLLELTSVNLPTQLTLSVVTIDYLKQDGSLLYSLDTEDNVTCEPTSITDLPASVKIGDFGVDYSLTCSDNSRSTSTWRIEDAFNGNIFIKFSFTEYDSLSNITSTGYDRYTLNSNGDIIGYSGSGTSASDNYTLNLRSN